MTSHIDEGVFYIPQGNPADKSQNSSVALSASLHNSKNFQSFRQCSSNRYGYTFIDGFQSKLVIACPGKALLQVYTAGKESVEMRIPVPEEIVCLASCKAPGSQEPWLLAGASKTGKVYIWELVSGLLLQVKEVHYQKVTVLKFTKNGEFLVSGSADSRVVIWKTFDLITAASQDDTNAKAMKPYATFTDHTLTITDIALTKGKINDVKIYTASQDCTIRCYDLHTSSLLTTFVTSDPVETLVLDSAERCLYFGTSTGLVRQVPLYVINPQTKVLEKVGGASKIITLPEDPELTSTFAHHQGHAVTALALSVDGSCICSGDKSGRLFVSDVITRQGLKKLKELPFAVTGIYCFLINEKAATANAKTGAATGYQFPILKRVLTGEQELRRHDVFRNSKGSQKKTTLDFEQFLDETRKEELLFANLTNVQSTVVMSNGNGLSSGQLSGDLTASNSSQVQELEDKLAKMTKNYKDLRSLYEQLYQEHNAELQKKST